MKNWKTNGIFLLTKRSDGKHFLKFLFLLSNYLTANQQIAYYDIREHFFFLVDMKQCIMIIRETLSRIKKKEKKGKKRFAGSSCWTQLDTQPARRNSPLCKHSLCSAPWTAAAQLQNLSRLMSTCLPRLQECPDPGSGAPGWYVSGPRSSVATEGRIHPLQTFFYGTKM